MKFLERIVSSIAAVGLAAVAWAAAAGEADPHAHHHAMTAQTTRSVVDYQTPDLMLVRDDGRAVALRQEIDDGRPVLLSFIYTSCTTICPVTSRTLAELQQRLGPASQGVHFMSISIDPEQDTPARLREYARLYGAGPQWQHYTGTLQASIAVQQAFGVYHGDKMSHAPVSLLRLASGSRWVRIDGFASAEQLLAELHEVVAAK